jgi:hypothetical protein
MSDRHYPHALMASNLSPEAAFSLSLLRRSERVYLSVCACARVHVLAHHILLDPKTIQEIKSSDLKLINSMKLSLS